MNKTKIYISILIILLLIFLALIIYLIFKINSNNENTVSNNNTSYNTTAESNSATEIAEDDDEDYDDENFDVFNEEDENGEAQYSEDALDNFHIEIVNLPNEVSEKIVDKDNFIKEIKEYMYFHGLVDATSVEYDIYQIDQENNKMAIRFILNNASNTRIITTIDLNNNEIEVSEA